MTAPSVDELTKHVKDNKDYDASSILVGTEQEAQSQYSNVTTKQPVDAE